MGRILILDAFAILSFLRGEEGSAQVQAYLGAAQKRGRPILAMSVVNAGEVFYIVQRGWGKDRAQEVLSFLLYQSGVRLYEATLARALHAADFKAQYAISLADAFAAALTEELGGILLTGDPEFRALEHRIPIEWLPTSPVARA